MKVLLAQQKLLLVRTSNFIRNLSIYVQKAKDRYQKNFQRSFEFPEENIKYESDSASCSKSFQRFKMLQIFKNFHFLSGGFQPILIII